MAQTIWHNVPAQILLHLQVVCSILLSALPIKTDYLIWEILIVCWKFPPNLLKGSIKSTQTTKRNELPERALKTQMETDVRLFMLFCFTSFSVWQVLLGSCFLRPIPIVCQSSALLWPTKSTRRSKRCAYFPARPNESASFWSGKINSQPVTPSIVKL